MFHRRVPALTGTTCRAKAPSRSVRTPPASQSSTLIEGDSLVRVFQLTSTVEPPGRLGRGALASAFETIHTLRYLSLQCAGLSVRPAGFARLDLRHTPASWGEPRQPRHSLDISGALRYVPRARPPSHTMSAHAHDVFLTYNWRDHAAVEAIGRALRDQALRVFLDRWYLVPGRPWPAALEAAVDECGALGFNTWVDLRAGLDDATGLSRLAAAIRGQKRQGQTSSSASRRPWPPSVPIVACAPFFFSRETFTEQLVEAVGQRTLVAVVGPSGSGKSSVVAAGLMPARSEQP
jgi:ABC-type multidrug transport system fused ATPase/permease subunit